jgi:hypothetical protein
MIDHALEHIASIAADQDPMAGRILYASEARDLFVRAFLLGQQHREGEIAHLRDLLREALTPVGPVPNSTPTP